MLSQPSQFAVGGPKEGRFWAFFFPALTANIGFWATLALNIPDFSRYARTQHDQAVGQAVGLPAAMGLFAFIGVAVTSATMVIYGEVLWDPVMLVSRFQNPVAHALALFAVCLATLATNVAANVVSPANDFANLWPRRISFRTGGLLTALVGVLMQPWHLVQDPSGFIFRWLVAYSGLLGSIGGVLIADYYVIRRTRLDVPGLYWQQGPYWYLSGFNFRALAALAAGIAPCVPGFLGTVRLAKVPEFWIELYHYAWFLSFAVAFAVYLLCIAPQALTRAARVSLPGK
jgi:NCS1 family nucleobase:cation symporter-1